jgi:hypothetical protein
MAGETDLVMFILGLCALCLDFLMGIVLLRKVATIKTSSKRKYYLGVAGFYIAHGTYVLTYVVYKATNNGVLFNFGVLLVLSSLVLLVYSIELSIFRRSRFFFTIFGIVSMGIIAVDVIAQATTSIQIKILGTRLMEWVQYFANPLLVAFILLVYLYAFMKAAGSVRRNALFMMVGIVLFIVAELSLSNVAKKILPWAEFLGPPLRVVAIVLLSLAIMRLSVWKDESEQLSRTKDAVQKQP